MQWYYLSDSHERIAVSEAQLPSLAARGALRPATPVWRRGMADWAACGEVKPEIFAAAVARHSDDHFPVGDSAAVRGTVTGLARTLAGYHVWLRLLGGIMIALSALQAAAMAWETWMLATGGLKSVTRGVAALGLFHQHGWLVWGLLALQTVFLGLSVWTAWVLLRAASRARRAAETGNELLLTAALQDVGRYFITTVIALLLGIALQVGLGLWLGWDFAFPKEAVKESKVSV